MVMIIGLDECAKEINSYKSLSSGKEMVPLVGAGFSCNAKPDFPLWEHIERWVALSVGLTSNHPSARSTLGKEADDFPLAVEWYYYMLDKDAKAGHATKPAYSQTEAKQVFCGRIKIPLVVTHLEPNALDAHKELVRKFETIFTTNWDCLLEAAIKEIGHSCTRSRLNLSNPAQWLEESIVHPGAVTSRRLVKYHGCCEDLSGLSIVASRSDYDQRVFLANMAIENKVVDSYDYILHRSSPLLIGYSYSDVNVRYVLSQVHSSYRNTLVGPIYNVVLDNPAFISPQKADMYEELYKIKTLCLLNKDHDYHKLRARYEDAFKLKPNIEDETIQQYKKEMTVCSRNAFRELFVNLI